MPASPTRTVEIVGRAALIAFGAIVGVDSYRLGAGWGSDGPQSGYFPFYIGLAHLHLRRGDARAGDVRAAAPPQAKSRAAPPAPACSSRGAR